MIISVHIPKTAGSSFKTALSEVYAEKLCLRYEQRPLFYRSQQQEIPLLAIKDEDSCEVLHGHFIADSVKGITGKGCEYITWLRNPVERVISHYNHWKRHPDDNQPISRAIHLEGMDLEAFSELEAMRDMQSFFLGKMKLDSFSFIGITERYEQSIQLFNASFNKNLHIKPSENCNPDKKAQSYKKMIGEALYAKISQWNQEDELLYAKGLSLMNERIRKTL